MRHRFALSSWLRPIALGTAIVIAVTAAAFAESLGGRGRYDIERQGLQNGIPPGAKENAIRELRALPLATPMGSWRAIGPQPLNNGQGLGPQGYCVPQTNPTVSGRVSSMAFGVAGTIYLGTAGGGVWKSTNYGANWIPLTDQAVSLSIGALAVVRESNAEDVIYAGTGESNQGADSLGLGILKSVDGGLTWEQLGARTFQNQGFARIVVVPGQTTDTDVVYAATMQTTIGSATSVRTSPRVIAGLFKSVNGGMSWKMLSGSGDLPAGGQTDGSVSEVVVSPVNSNLVYAGIICSSSNCAKGGIWESPNAGDNWVQAPGMPNAINRVAISISPDGYTLYAAVVIKSSLTANFFSNDAGDSWRSVSLPPVIRREERVCVSLGQGNYDLAIESDPSNPATVYEALIGIYKSTDNGGSWKYIGNGSHSDFHAIGFSGKSLYSGNDGGIFVSSDSGNTWDSSLNNTLNTVQFQSVASAPAGTTLVVGGTQDNGTNVFRGNLAWRQQTGGDGGLSAIARTKPSTVFGEYQLEQRELPTDNVFRFVVGNIVTTRISPPYTKMDAGKFYTPLILDPNNDDRLLVATNRIWESCRIGAEPRCNATTLANKPNWRAISKFFPAALTGIAIAPTNPAVLYAVTDTVQKADKTLAPFAFVTSNSEAPSPDYIDVSASLTSAGIASRITSVAISPINAAIAAVTATGFTSGGLHVFLTQNYGQSWTDISTKGSGFPNDPTLVVYFDQNDITGQTLFAGTTIGILQTTNLGKNWTNLSLNQLPLVQVYSISENANTLTIATHGRGVWQLQIAAVPQTNANWSTLDVRGRMRQLVFGGTMTLTNTGSSTESVNSIVLALSQPKLLSQVTLTSGGNRASVSPSTTSTVNLVFSPPVQIATGAAATFRLSAVVASSNPPNSLVSVPSGGVGITNGSGPVVVNSLPALLGKISLIR
jgi:photosystem II stability/assembly factor-like uncharacterized protein